MRFFTSDLYRQLGIGFVLGAVLVVAANAQQRGDPLASPASAAQTVNVPQPAPEFLLQPLP